MADARMATVSPEAVQPISLYLDLFPDRTADLEAVSHAALHFVTALKEAAKVLSPELEIRIELQSGSEGSLDLHSFITLISHYTELDAINIRFLAMTAAAWFSSKTIDWTVGRVLDTIFPKADSPPQQTALTAKTLTDAEVESIAKRLNEIQKSPKVQGEVGRIYRSLNVDDSIRGVGFKLDHSTEKPDDVVKKSEFESRILDAKDIETTKEIKITDDFETVKLVGPILDPSSRRKWKLLSAEGVPFSAAMDDVQFKELLSNGKLTTTLHSDTRLRARITKTYVLGEDNIWHLQTASITKVERLILPGSQENLLPDSGDDDTDAE